MLQTVPSAAHNSDSYAAYAENFDLSLLPMDGDVSTISTNPQSLSPSDSQTLMFTQQQDVKTFPRPLTPDYIPTTIASVAFADTKPAKSRAQRTNTVEDRNQVAPSSENIIQHIQQDYQYYPTGLPLSPPQEPFLTIFPPSPSPSIEFNSQLLVKQEQTSNFGLYPPSPPDSNGAPSPIGHCVSDIKSEPYEIGPEPCLDLSTLFGNTFNGLATATSPVPSALLHSQQRKDHQLLREYLQDTTFQRKHNLKPLALESLFVGEWGARGDIEPVISLALEHARKDVQETCIALNISSGEFLLVFFFLLLIKKRHY